MAQEHPGDSSVQRRAEMTIRQAASEKLGVDLQPQSIGGGPRVDGFADGDPPFCAEIWAHQGTAKSAQRAKVMKDMCKLLLCDRLLGRHCRKVFVVSDEAALQFLDNSWQGRFAEEYGIEPLVVEIPGEIRQEILAAQRRQYR